MDYFNDDLRELQRKVLRKRKLESMLENMLSQKASLDLKVEELRQSKLDEEDDVKRLENGSLATFFYNVVGKMDEKLDKEKQEAYEATVKYDLAVKDLNKLNEDIELLDKELKDLHGIEEKYDSLFNEKIKFVESSKSKEAIEVYNIQKEIAHLENQAKEVKEAINEGNKASELIDNVDDYLNAADGLATWDLIGGGLFIDLMKRDNMNSAQREIESLQMQLRKFKTELTDVTIDDEFNIDLANYMPVMDYIFDGLFVDWMVKDKIKSTEMEIDNVAEKVDEALEKLNRISDKINLQKKEKEAELENLVNRF